MADKPSSDFAPVERLGYVHSAPPESIEMGKHHLLLLIERIQKRPRPHGEWCLIGLSIFSAVVFPLLTSEFKDAFGVEKAAWKAVAILAAWVSGLSTIGLFLGWVVVRFLNRNRTPETIYDEIVAQMARDRAAAMQRANPITPTPDQPSSPA